LATLISNIKLLVNTRRDNLLLRGTALSHLQCIENAYLEIEDGKISGYGKMDERPIPRDYAREIDANTAHVLPCWCDSHTHLVFAASREEEFIDKLKGLSYAAIAAKGEAF
jgi:imidazolonepropionase